KLARQSGRRTVAAPDGVSAAAAADGGATRFEPFASESKNVRAESSDCDGARHSGDSSTFGLWYAGPMAQPVPSARMTSARGVRFQFARMISHPPQRWSAQSMLRHVSA